MQREHTGFFRSHYKLLVMFEESLVANETIFTLTFFLRHSVQPSRLLCAGPYLLPRDTGIANRT